MPKQLQITIPEPCHENWAEMTPIQQGAYCKVCSKNVIDFTTKTENEIYDILTQSDGNTCGRFTSFQLQQPIRKTEINNGWFNWRAIAASLAAMLAFEETARASGKAENAELIAAEIPLTSNANNVYIGEDEVISGVVVDRKTYDRVPFATIIWKDDSTEVKADSTGRFKIVNPGSHKRSMLVVTAPDYKTVEVDVYSLKRNDIIEMYSTKPLDPEVVNMVVGKASIPEQRNTDLISGQLIFNVADTTGTISGKVVDAKTKEPLLSATVYCKSDRTVYTVTDEFGKFTMPIGNNFLHKNDTIVIQYLGFTNREILVADFMKKYNGSVLEIQMSQAVLVGFGIVVVNPVKMGKFKKAHMRRMERKNKKGH